MFHLNGIQRQATFFLILGYPRETVMCHLRAAYPGEDADAAWEHALAQQRESERQLNAAVARDDRRAVDAEHDLGKTMHKGD